VQALDGRTASEMSKELINKEDTVRDASVRHHQTSCTTANHHDQAEKPAGDKFRRDGPLFASKRLELAVYL
jgi:hypothetical protein